MARITRRGFRFDERVPNVPNRPDLEYMRDEITGEKEQYHVLIPPIQRPPVGGILQGTQPPQQPKGRTLVELWGVGSIRAAEVLPVKQVGCPQVTASITLPANVSKDVLPAWPRRRYLFVRNASGATVFYATGRPATTADEQIASGGFIEPLVAPTNSVNLLSVGGGAVVVIAG